MPLVEKTSQSYKSGKLKEFNLFPKYRRVRRGKKIKKTSKL
jgi:hypothetical protein